VNALLRSHATLAPKQSHGPHRADSLVVGLAVRCMAFAALMLCASAPAASAQGPKDDRVVVLVFARGGADANVSVRIERDLRTLFDAGHREDKKIPRTLEVELRFDAGVARRGELGRARRHFNDAQRAMERNDPEEALDQLVRAQRKYRKAAPFATDPALLSGIYYYEYLGRLGLKQTKRAIEAYCAYVAWTRNYSGSQGPLEQFEPLADKCGDTATGGTSELLVTSNVDGAHVYVDGKPEGVIGKALPLGKPFIQAGPHMVEVRKAGFARWGTVVRLKKDRSLTVNAKLREARNRATDYDRLALIQFTGEQADSEAFLDDRFFELTELYGATYLVAGYLEPDVEGQNKLTLMTFHDFNRDTYSEVFGLDRDAHQPALAGYWKKQFGKDVDPGDAEAVIERAAPTMFKVE
jgi:hypothetical protein